MRRRFTKAMSASPAACSLLQQIF